MGTIISPAKAIDRIWWKPYKKNQPLKAISVVVIGTDGTSVMVAKLADGSFICSHDLSKYAYMPGSWPWTRPVLMALVRLGAISQADMDEHMALADRIVAEREREYQADTLASTLAAAGLEPSPDQAAFIAANTKKSRKKGA